MAAALIGAIVAAVALGASALAIAWRGGSRLATIESAIGFMRRDLDQILRLYKLTPVSERERRGRR